MLGLRTIAAAGLALVTGALPTVARARKPLSTAMVAPVLVKPAAALRLDLPPVARAAGACRLCGAGLPDARVGRNLLLGADGMNDRVRLYVKRDFRQLSVDVGPSSALVGYGFRF